MKPAAIPSIQNFGPDRVRGIAFREKGRGGGEERERREPAQGGGTQTAV